MSIEGSSLRRPAITAAQIAGLAVGGVPIVAALLRAFGVYDLSPEQQDALKTAVDWGAVTAASLFASDAGLRAARNHAHAKVEALRSSWSTPEKPVVPKPRRTVK